MNITMFGRSLSKSNVLASALLVALAGLAYANTLSNPLVYDDIHNILANPSIKDLSIPHGLLYAVVYSPFRPFANLTYAFNYQLGGVDPFGYHVTNLVLHIINVCLVFWLMLWCAVQPAFRIQHGSRLFAWLAAAFFAVHPLLSEAVGYISARPELLCTTWILASLLFFTRFIQSTQTKYLFWGLVCWFFSLLAKEVGAVLPLVVFLAHTFLKSKEDFFKKRQAQVFYGIWFAVVLLLGATRLGYFFLKEQSMSSVSIWLHWLTQVRVCWRLSLIHI